VKVWIRVSDYDIELFGQYRAEALALKDAGPLAKPTGQRRLDYHGRYRIEVDVPEGPEGLLLP